MKSGHWWAVSMALLSVRCRGQAEPPVVVPNPRPSDKAAHCTDADPKCSGWASQGECKSNEVWMTANCQKSCDSCENGDDAWRLRKDIAKRFHTANNVSQDGPESERSVSLLSVVFSHVQLSENSQSVAASGKLVLAWNDSRLAWTPSDWGGLSWLNFFWSHIWTPSLVQSNGMDNRKTPLKRKVLAANYTGQAFLWTEFAFRAPCALDYSAWPADSHRCCFRLDDQRYFAVRLQVSPNAVTAARKSLAAAHVSGWLPLDADVEEAQYAVRVLSHRTQDPLALESSSASLCVTLQRNRAYFSAEVVGPAVVTALLVLLSFAAPSYAAQTRLLLASLGLQFVANYTTASQLPPASGSAPAILTFNGANLGLTSLLLCLVTGLRRLSGGAASFPPPHRLKLLAEALRRRLGGGEAKAALGENDANDAKEAKEENGAWAPVAAALSSLLLLIVAPLYALLIFCCLLL